MIYLFFIKGLIALFCLLRDFKDEFVLKKNDTISIPHGVCRSFTNIGKEEELLQVIISEGVHDMNNISFTPLVVSKMEK